MLYLRTSCNSCPTVLEQLNKQKRCPPIRFNTDNQEVGSRNIQCRSIMKREAVNLFLLQGKYLCKALHQYREKAQTQFLGITFSLSYGVRCKEPEQALLTWPESHPGLFKNVSWGKIALWRFLADCPTAGPRRVRTATRKVSCSTTSLPESAAIQGCECMQSKPSG